MIAKRNRVHGVVAAGLLVGLAVMGLPTAQSAGNVHGFAQFEKVAGRPDLGYVQLYEYKAFLTPDGSNRGYSYHCGDPGTAPPGEAGTGVFWFQNVPAGNYSILTAFPEFFPRGKVLSNVVVTNGQTTERNANECIDYSAYYSKNEWDPIGSMVIYQTFVATGTSISRASFAKADNDNTGSVRVSIHEDNGGNVETWPQVGPSRSVNRGGYSADHWVAWQAGDVVTFPGRKYAIRLQAVLGGPLQPYWSNDGLYPQGTGYRGTQSSPAGRDYYIVVFSDNDNTIATLQVGSAGYGGLASDVFREKWAQSYLARGTSLAGSVLMTTIGGGGSGWNFDVRISVHQDTPDGPQIGPSKTMPNAFAPYFGVSGVSFNRGEVPTTIGRTYWIVHERPSGEGFNASRMNEGNIYWGGTGAYYHLGAWTQLSFDLFMDIFEYADTSPTPTPQAQLQNPSFEQSSLLNHPGWTNDAEFETNGRYPNPGTAHEGEKWSSYSYGGGQTRAQELYQVVTVTPGRTYTLSAWCNIGGQNGTATALLQWYDGAVYPGRGNGGTVASLTWSHPDPLVSWTQLSGQVTPVNNRITFILRAEISGWGGGVNFDDCSVSQSAPPCTNDADGDGVCDEQEDPNNAVQPGRSNRILSDSDGDGLSDGAEDSDRNGTQGPGETGTRTRDTDGDNFIDGLDPNPLTPNAGFSDADNDELHAASDPNSANPDTDGDFYKDGYEAAFFKSAAAAGNAAQKPYLGDVNGDTFVTSLDALVIQSLFLEIINHTNAVFDGPAVQDAFRFGDANRDGFVTSLDALIVQSYFLRILQLLPL